MKLSDNLAKKAVDLKTINQEDVEIYTYSYQMFFMTILLWVSAILVGIVFRQFFGMLLFMAFFVPLRQYSGGIHVQSKWVCYGSTVAVFLFIVITSNLSIITELQLILWWLLPISAVILLLLAPQEDENKPTTENEHKYCRRIARIILVVELIVVGIMCWLSNNSILCYFSLSGIHLCAVLVLAKSVQKLFDR